MDAINSTTESLIVQRAASIPYKTIASTINKDDSTISRILSSSSGVSINELGAFLDVLGLKVIECEGSVVSLPEQEYQALRVLAKKGI